MTAKVSMPDAGQALILGGHLFAHLSGELTILSSHDSHWNLEDSECA